jgi:hypothetical protein
VEQDFAAAADWYYKAAEQGHNNAQFNLGVLCYNGDGVEQNYLLTYFWWYIAGAAGWEDAANNLDLVLEKLSPEDINYVQSEASNWIVLH